MPRIGRMLKLAIAGEERAERRWRAARHLSREPHPELASDLQE
jgi:hypothetical protein